MRCPRCGSSEDKVNDTRPSDEGRSIRRRRECISCGYRYSTIERVEVLELRVVKKDGIREEYSRDKLMRSLSVACSKRPISNDDLMKIVGIVENLLQEQRNGELSTQVIGETVMAELKKIDKVAYVRFASVYRDFTDISSFAKEIEEINKG